MTANEYSLRLFWNIQTFLARPHRFIRLLCLLPSTSYFLFLPIFNCIFHVFAKKTHIISFSLPLSLSSFYFEFLLNEMIINHIFYFLFSAHKIYKIQNETHKHAHTRIKQNSKKKNLQNTQKQICQKIYIKYVCMKPQILEEVLQSLLFKKLFFSHSLCLSV